MERYNGWPNRITWKASLYCSDAEDVQILKESLEEALESLPIHIADFLQEGYNEIDWDYLLSVFPAKTE